jgi:heme A synthase
MPKAFARYAWAVLVYNLAVILWGAYVRATGSGAGCGNHWPLCNGQVTPGPAGAPPMAATIIEFTHRVTSGLDLALVTLLVIWAFRRFPRKHPVRLGAALSAVFLVTEALIGAALVLLDHVASNASVSRAYSLSTHQINTLTLLACLTLTAWWSMEEKRAPAPPRPRGRAVWMAAVGLAAVAVVGVSGAIVALGDTLFPAPSLAAGLAQDLNPAANIFLRLRLFHPVIAVGAGAWLLFYAGSSASRRPDTRGRALSLMALVIVQLMAGMVNTLLLAPVWMQIVHLLLADLLWITLVLVCASMLSPAAESL